MTILKYAAHLILAFTALVLILTSTVNAADTAPVLSRIQKSGKLVLGTSGTMTLMSEKTMTGEVIGYDIDMANALAESMGVELVTKISRSMN